mmetsp:Transcript_214/g.557  ORF Transcript_214/g.557 Transcript_214/m.557 type:complete len:93 (-) Transcript_214:726-1004(-)
MFGAKRNLKRSRSARRRWRLTSRRQRARSERKSGERGGSAQEQGEFGEDGGGKDEEVRSVARRNVLLACVRESAAHSGRGRGEQRVCVRAKD